MSTTAQTPAEIQEQARQVYRQSVDAEMPLSGKKLGQMFGMSDRWGRLRIQECAPETPGGTGGGNPERKAETRAEGGTETPDERNGNGTGQAETPAETGVEAEAETSDGNPGDQDADQPVDQGGGVPEPGNPLPDSGTPGGSPAAEPLPPVPVAAPSVPDGAPRHSAVPASVPVSVPGGSAVPRAGRGLAWSAFLLGTAFSVAANVAHARPEWGARIAGAFWPVALILAVELMSRPIWRNGRRWALARYGGTGLVAAVTAITSYWHMRGLLLTYGEDAGLAYIGPLAVDGLMIVAGFALLALTDRPDKA